MPLQDAEQLPRGPTQISLDSYDTSLEDAQRPMPKLEDLMTPEPARGRVPGPEEAPAPLKEASVPPTLRNAASPQKKPKPDAEEALAESPGPSVSSAPTPAPPCKSKRSKSPSYWRPGLTASCVFGTLAYVLACW